MRNAFFGMKFVAGMVIAWGLIAGLRAATPEDVAGWQRAAMDGDVMAQWKLSQAYENRDGVELDYGRAMVWKHSAAEGGVAEAQYSLAANYFKGELGLSRDMRTALKWLRLAAIQGHVEASYRLGEVYFIGFDGVEKNYALVAAAMKKPAQEDFEEAKVYLGYLMFTGQGTAKDELQGAAMLRDAALAGHERALDLLWEANAAGKLEPENDAELRSWLEAGLKLGDIRAKERLGLSLFLGQGMETDRDRARPLLMEAAEKGSVPAATALAQEIGERLSSPEGRELNADERRRLILEYNRMAHLIAVSGGTSGMETYIRAISHLRPMEKLVRLNENLRLSMGEDLIEALAWGRIYRAEGGSDESVLSWAASGEIWLKNYPPAAARVAQREQELLKLSAPARAR